MMKIKFWRRRVDVHRGSALVRGFARFAPLFLPLSLAMLGWGCGGGSPPEPPPSTTVPPDTTTTVEPSPPPPPPPDDARPEDYITVERAGNLVKNAAGVDWCAHPESRGLLQELCFTEQTVIWQGHRNLLYAHRRCRAHLPGQWGVTPDELLAIGTRGGEIHADLVRFMDNLERVNRRCDEQPRFCGRTEVNRDRFSRFRSDALEPHLKLAGELGGIQTWCARLGGGP